MIRQNLGGGERAVRLLLGLGIAAWALTQPALAVKEWVALLAATFLVLNGVFGRCYLWALLNLNTCERRGGRCDERATGS